MSSIGDASGSPPPLLPGVESMQPAAAATGEVASVSVSETHFQPVSPTSAGAVSAALSSATPVPDPYAITYGNLTMSPQAAQPSSGYSTGASHVSLDEVTLTVSPAAGAGVAAAGGGGGPSLVLESADGADSLRGPGDASSRGEPATAAGGSEGASPSKWHSRLMSVGAAAWTTTKVAAVIGGHLAFPPLAIGIGLGIVSAWDPSAGFDVSLKSLEQGLTHPFGDGLVQEDYTPLFQSWGLCLAQLFHPTNEEISDEGVPERELSPQTESAPGTQPGVARVDREASAADSPPTTPPMQQTQSGPADASQPQHSPHPPSEPSPRDPRVQQ